MTELFRRRLLLRSTAASLCSAVAMLLLPAPISAAPGDKIYSRPAQLLDAGDGAKLNVICIGTGSPAVVFDSGWGDWAPAWAVVQPRIAVFTRACSYDRAGSGFSEPGPTPRTTERIATELHTALRNGGIAGPYVLVGSAFGGDHVRAFADLFPKDVAGLVMVDGDASDVDRPLRSTHSVRTRCRPHLKSQRSPPNP